ncbi:TonB-dependent receptor [Mangrovimicrobium sediminis]|uniref:TonB-dependent receptor n=1 Tax=Mangrovimicrobium sediminis TaxID=2562682 RepID=A0A4Z0M822_9GAMM|nr:TonB-dependent receptor [Haliea sp. SAOS-164]TGD75614.1 TonB-dependent receptor [Haliea sp. SAOS-164]
MTHSRKFHAASVFFATAVLSQAVAAQTPSSTAGGAMLEEVMVTAQRREATLMSVPLSIQAMSGEKLTNSGITDLSSLKFTTPGYFPDTNNGFVQIYMRGIGNAIFLGADPSVATFIDDVPQIYGMSVDELVDVERVEILKGAQGGLYGRNATGGVVNIITRQPSLEELTGEVRVSYGEEDTFRGTAYVNVPLGDMAAWSLSLEKSTHDPYIKNNAARTPYSAAYFPSGSFLGTPQQTADFFNAGQKPSEIYDRDFTAARTKLLLQPTDDLSITLAANYAEKDDTASSQFVSSTPEFNQAALVGLINSFGIQVELPPGFIPDNTNKDWTTAIGPEQVGYIEDKSGSATVVWNGPGFDLTSITAYREMENKTRGDSGTSAVLFVPFDISSERDYVYQEFRFTSTGTGPWSYLGGLTYLDNNLSGHTDVYFLSYDVLFGVTEFDQEISNWSAYAELGYDLTDRLNLTVSGRYMTEENDVKFTQPVVSGINNEESKFVPSATLSYQMDDSLFYLRWAQGFKTGGVNVLVAPAFYPQPSDGSIFDPETVDTFEAGFKASLADRSVQVTGAVFYNDYSDLQVDVRARPEFPAITSAIINADSAETWGVEGSVAWQVAAPLTLGVNAGYLQAEYKDFALAGSEVLADFDLSGEQMPKAPEWQLSVDAALDQPIGENLRLVGNVLAAYTDEVVFKYSALPGILPDATGDSYWLVNARIGVHSADDKWGFDIVADNLFDEVYYIGADAGVFGNLLNYGNRRIVRGELIYRF